MAWASNQWHQVVLNYNSTNSSLYIDGQAMVTNGAGVTCYPGSAIRAIGFRIGSDASGNSQARGAFDELNTFNYRLDVDDDGDGLSNLQEYQLGTDPNNPDTDADGRTDWQEFYDTTAPLNPAIQATWAIVADVPGDVLGTNATFWWSQTNSYVLTNSPGSGAYLGIWMTNGAVYYTVLNGESNAVYSLFGAYSTDGPWSRISLMRTGAVYVLHDTNQFNPLSNQSFYALGISQDSDGDGLPDMYEELVSNTDPAMADSDENGITDSSEYVNFKGLTKLQAFAAQSAPAQVATPVFSPAIGYAARTNIITCATPGVTIHYTTDGSDPTESSPVTYSGMAVWMDKPMTLKANAWKSGMTPSGIQAATYMVGKVVMGAVHSLALRSDGSVWSWGPLGGGLQGSGTFDCSATVYRGPWPVDNPNFKDVVDIAAGFHFSMALKKDGTVWCWGTLDGTCGSVQWQPTEVMVGGSPLSGVVQIAAGWKHCAALKADGTVWVWNQGSTPTELKVTTSTYLNTVKSIAAGRTLAGQDFTISLKSDGTVWRSVGAASPGLSTQVTALTGTIKTISTYLNQSYALRSDGKAWRWVDNGAPSQLVGYQGTILSDVVTVGGGADFGVTLDGSSYPFYTIFMRTDGTIWTCGDYDFYHVLGVGQEFVGQTIAKYRRIDPSTDHYFQDKHVVQIFTGARDTGVWTDDGSIWTWGDNYYFEFGMGPNVPYSSPTPTKAIFTDGYNLLIPSVQSNVDSDGDGLPDWKESQLGTDPNNRDSNGDGIPDAASLFAGISPIDMDVDGDGIPNATEILNGTNPFSADTDGDGVADGLDVYPLDPTRSAAQALSTTQPTITVTIPVNAILQ